MTELQELIVAAAREPGAMPIRISEQLGVNSGYVSQVLRRAGIDIVSGRSRSTAKRLAQYHHPIRAKTSRPCICCGQRFWSEGPHNRMCTPCRNLPTE